jgi:hypothetical protein
MNSISNSRLSLDPSHRYHRYAKRFEFGSHNVFGTSYEALPWSKSGRKALSRDENDFSSSHKFLLDFQTNDSARLYLPSGAFLGAIADFGTSMQRLSTASGASRSLAFDTSGWISYGKSASTLKLFNSTFSMSLGCGWGRIRDVTFAAVALGMLDRLKTVHPQSRGLDAARVQDFASYIEKRRRQRSFDGRLSLIENIDSLSQYLVDGKALDGPSSAATMELADQWAYAFSQKRQAGIEVSLYPGISVEYARTSVSRKNSQWRDSLLYDLSLTDSDESGLGTMHSLWEGSYLTKNYQTTVIYSLNTSFQFARPVNRYFQLRARADLSFLWNHYFARSAPSAFLQETSYEQLLPVMDAAASCEMAYYPDTRTTFSLAPNASYHRSFNYFVNKNWNSGTADIVANGDRHNDFRGITLEFPLTIAYFVSPRLQYRIWASSLMGTFYSSQDSDTKAWRSTYALGAQATYQLF